MRDAYPQLQARGLDVAVIGTGGSHYSRAFREDFKIPFRLMLDKELKTYRTVGAQKGSFFGLLNPKLLLRSLKAVKVGGGQGKSGPHPFQFGATHLLLPDGRVPFAWVNDDYPDNPPLDRVLAALP